MNSFTPSVILGCLSMFVFDFWKSPRASWGLSLVLSGFSSQKWVNKFPCLCRGMNGTRHTPIHIPTFFYLPTPFLRGGNQVSSLPRTRLITLRRSMPCPKVQRRSRIGRTEKAVPIRFSGRRTMAAKNALGRGATWKPTRRESPIRTVLARSR
jgi:hypothetical protein